MSDFHPVAEQIENLLKEKGAEYQRFEHGEVRTSEEAAAVRPDFSLSEGAKALIVRAKYAGGEKKFFQVVVPGDKKFDAKKLRKVLHSQDIRFVNENEVEKITGGVKPGGVPPFGNLFGLEVYVDKQVLENDRIIFNAGDRRVSITLSSENYRRVVDPAVVDIV